MKVFNVIKLTTHASPNYLPSVTAVTCASFDVAERKRFELERNWVEIELDDGKTPDDVIMRQVEMAQRDHVWNHEGDVTSWMIEESEIAL